MANPFSVTPGNDYTKGLSGLSDVIGQIGERKRKEEVEQKAIEKFAKMKQGAMAAMKSNDPDTIRQFMVSNPEMSQAMKATIETKFPGQSGDVLKNAYFRAAVDFSQAPALLKEMETQFATDGIDPQEQAKLDTFKNKLDTDPEGAKKEIESQFAMIAEKEDWQKYKDITKQTDVKKPTTAMGQFIKNNPNATSEELIKFTQDLKDVKGGKYEGLSSGYETYLRANNLENSPENYTAFNQQENKLKKELKDNGDKYPLTSELAAKGWMPSGRITGPQMDFLESAARRANELGIPLTPEKLRDMEFQAQKNRSTGASAGSRLVIARKQNIEAANGILKDLKATSEKLNYTPVKFLSALEKFQKGQLGDPLFTEYMAQRADSLFILGNALKQNGLTDKSIEVEEEAFSPTLSPQQFNAWYNTQIRALNRAAEEMNSDYKFGLSTSPSYPAGQAGAPTKENPIPTMEIHDPLGIR